MIHFQDSQVPLDVLDAPVAPLRESIDPAYIGELADSMATTGLLQPIGARGPSPAGRYEVVWGDCRTRAARSLGWLTILARVCAWRTNPGEARAAENLHRADLNPREEAREVARLRAEGQADAAIARILRRSASWVAARVELLTWPVDVQDQVATGQLTMSAARLLSQIDHGDYRASLIGEIQRTGATANVVAIWLAHYEADRERIIRNAETVKTIVGRREDFIVLARCEVCDESSDSRYTVLLRVCPNCQRTLEDEKRAATGAPTG